ncbi:hypothetical protein O181_039516 [Austropuccinia psidii MF-1]|uniref:Uncharacterized protein n=1 Tax=Austropuccinia psidii MF-1 TaxID=1389203 RepID=A0A9Q3D9T6_9BASI|nr:hypothetical protein [Austropuccinia psidii MF-1]
MLSMAASKAKVGIETQNIFINKMTWMDLMEEMRGWKPNINFNLLGERATRIRENKEAIQSINNSWHIEEPRQIQEPQYREVQIPSSPKHYRSSSLYKPKANSSRNSHKS